MAEIMAIKDLILTDIMDRRAAGRTQCNRGAIIGIPGLKRLFSFTVRDASDRGVGMRIHSKLVMLPVEFIICEERFWTVRQCRLIWREGDFAGAEFIDNKKLDAPGKRSA
jgi:hypothetical protein